MKTTKHFKRISFLITLFSISQVSLMATTTTLFPSSIPAAEMSESKDINTIDYNQYIVSDLLLPRNLYILKGYYPNHERLNLFYNNALLTLSSTYNMSAYSAYGLFDSWRWLYKTPSYLFTLPQTPFELNILAKVGNEYMDKSTHIELVDTLDTTPVRLLAIGDSLTRSGVYLSQVENKLPNVTFLGTRVYPNDGMPAREGRGGWSLENYFTYFNGKSLDSPFMFPTSVSAEHYKGNTQDWKNICYGNPDSPTYSGFQKLARGWQDEGDYLYDINGYYKYPSIGDVMVDPNLPVGIQWVKWNGVAWQTMLDQPSEFEFNFSKYMIRHQEAFSEGTPTHISILLGANEFGFNKDLDQMHTFINRLNTLIDSIHAFDPNIKIILCTPTVAPNATRITSSLKNFYLEYDLRIKYATSCLLKAFDTDEALDRQVYIAPMTLTLDSNLGFDYIEKTETIGGILSTVIDVKNSIHPNNTYGQLQMGDTLAAVIQKFR